MGGGGGGIWNEFRWVSINRKSLIVTYFDSFGVEHIPKEIKKIIGNINIVTNIYRIQVIN